MDFFEKQCDALRGDYQAIIHLLHTVNEDNADDVMEYVRSLHASTELKRQKLFGGYSKEELRDFSQEIDEMTKQILEIFDNIIEKYKCMIASVQQEMLKLHNQKKISNYQR